MIFFVFLCILGFGVEFAYKNRHINSGKHAQELDVDFLKPPKASDESDRRAEIQSQLYAALLTKRLVVIPH